jgi:hypothetical protein
MLPKAKESAQEVASLQAQESEWSAEPPPEPELVRWQEGEMEPPSALEQEL